MAQIIKHRRGSIDSLKDVSARKGELIIATGSVGNMNGPWVFLGDSDGVAGGYKVTSKIYQGADVPTISVGSYGSTLNGTPFYSSNSQTLFILSSDGNTSMDLTGNIEGNVISGVTINNLTGSTATLSSFVSASALNVQNNAQVLGNIDVTGTSTVGGATTINNNLTVTGNTSVSGTTNLGGAVNVSGNTTLNGSVTVTGLTENRLVVVGVNGLLEDDANLTFDGSKLNVGQGQFEVDVNTGELRTSGSITMKGNITIGDGEGGDLIDFNGEVSSSIIPSGSNLFDLGSPTNNWRNLHVSGTAYVNVLEAQSISLDGITVFEDLVVSGSSFLGQGEGDVVIVSGSIFNDALTQGRIVHVGVDGQLVDNENFTYDLNNGFLMNTSGSIDVNTSGSLNIKTEGGDDIFVSSSDNLNFEAADDINITAGDDLRIYSNDTFSLRNYSTEDSITLITNYDGDNEKTMSFDVDGNLTIPGGFTGSFANIDTQAQLASAAVEDLTENRIVVVGVGGELEDDANFTFDGTTFNIGEGDFEVDVNGGNIRTSGSLDVNATASLATAIVEDLTQGRIVHVGVGGALIDDSDFTFDGTTFKIGDGNFEVDVVDGDIRTSGSLTIGDSLTINGDQTVNGTLTVTGNTIINSDLYVSGNVEFLGGATYVYISSSVIELDDNIIKLNAYAPFERYAGFEVMDSGSTGVSASLVWDGMNDYWMFVSSSGQSSKLIGTTAGSYGSETSLTSGTFPIATGASTIGDSLLKYSGTTLSFNTNKFTVDSTDGATTIAGGVTLSFSGGTDNGSATSAIMFRNSSNLVGYVTTVTGSIETNGLLGYRQDTGALVFSDLIDGGTYS
jgi:predicted acyltransferase (DUF342 family)